MENNRGGYRQINKSLNICAFDDYLKGQTANLPVIANVEQLTPRVLRILGQNPGKGTNTYVIGTGDRRIMVDTSGGEPEWAELVASTLDSMNIRLSHVLLTHWHGDHTGGVPDLIRMYPELKSSIYKNKPDRGHSEDHMCFILEEEQAMLTGDNILGTGTSAVEDLGSFMTSLKKMYDQNCALGYSAYGITIQNLPMKIGRELGQKWRRERQVLEALERSRMHSVRSLAIKDVVSQIYGESMD
ncbi:hypothetical protein LTR50_005933 [Elasticomyces elasticus]|nr:hypothetical protein LTR50_005933 [Elasticomyces elasticus]